MPTTVPTSQVIVIALLMVAGYFVFKKAAHVFRFVKRFVDAVEANAKAAEALAELPKYVKGHHAVSLVMVREIIKFRESVAAFSGLLLKGDPKESTLSTYDDRQVGEEYAIEQILAAAGNLSREEAEEMVKAGYDTLGAE